MMDKEHTSREFERELRELRERLLAMSRGVEGQVARAVDAMIDRDVERAQQVIAFDAAIDRDENAIDELGFMILARRQPVASDLRLVMLALKVVADLERIGDMAVNIAKRVPDLAELPVGPIDEGIVELSNRVIVAVELALGAFVEADVGRAQEVIDGDRAIDALNSRLFSTIVADEEKATLPTALALSSVCRYLERVGDHATNIAEMVIYALAGERVRHRG
jgi:phosphate transport system protein